jgi:ketosteroid isomerase-like protein
MNNAEIIRSLYESFKIGDIPAVLGAFDENISWTDAEGFPHGGTYIGANAILENVFINLGSEWEGFSAVPTEYVDGGDKIVALGNYSGKYVKTGKSINVPFAHVWTLAGGKITEFVQYTDTLKVSEAL